LGVEPEDRERSLRWTDLPTKFECKAANTRGEPIHHVRLNAQGMFLLGGAGFCASFPHDGRLRGVGELIVLAERLADRSRPVARNRDRFFFDLVCPFSYLAAERIERELGHVDWGPGCRDDAARQGPSGALGRRTDRRRADRGRAFASRSSGRRSCEPRHRRAACRDVRLGAGSRSPVFARGEPPRVLRRLRSRRSGDPRRGAAAAGVPLEECLHAAGDMSRDGAAHATARGLRSRNVRELPAVRVHHSWLSGQQAVAEAGAMIRARHAIGRPLAPAS